MLAPGQAPTLHDVKSLPAAARWGWHILDASQIGEIWGSIVALVLWAALVVALDQYVDAGVAINNSLLSVLSLLISLSISLRVSSSYERHQSGRALWSSLGKHVRDFATLVALHVRHKPHTGCDEAERDERAMRLLLEKQTIFNVVAAFAPAAKHALRHEAGLYYDDLFPLISTLPRFAGSTQSQHDVAILWRSKHPETGELAVPDPEKGLSTPMFGNTRPSSLASMLDASGPAVLLTESKSRPPSRPQSVRIASEPDVKAPSMGKHRTWPGRSSLSERERADPASLAIELEPGYKPPTRTGYDYLPLLYFFRPILHAVFRVSRTEEEELAHRQRKLRKTRRFLSSNIPLELSLHLSNFVSSLPERELCDANTHANLMNALSGMNDAFVGMDKIATTPLPFSYSFHLQAVTYIFLFLLPFFVVETFGWLSLLGVGVTSFFFVGFNKLATALEEPFGYDDVDLPLDAYCRSFAVEIAEIAAYVPYDPASMVDDPANRPFASTGDLRTAQEILGQHSAETGIVEYRRHLRRTFEQQRGASKFRHKGPHPRVEVKTV